MLIFIYGDDNFRVEEKAQEMISAFRKKFDSTGLNTQVFPVEGSSKLEAGEILQAVCSYPFMSERRLVIINNLISTSKKNEQDVWIEGLKRIPDSTIVLILEKTNPKVLEKKSLFKELQKLPEVHFYPFAKLEGYELKKWVKNRIESSGKKIDNLALQSLVERVGSDLWQMNNEINKIINLSDQKQINQKMIEENISANFEGEIFSLIDAIANKNKKLALELLQKERWSGANDFYLITMLARQIRLLISARSALDDNPQINKQDLAEIMGVHPFVVQKVLQQAKFFTLDNLKKIHNLLFKFDWQMKTGLIEAGLAVDLIVTELIK